MYVQSYNQVSPMLRNSWVLNAHASYQMSQHLLVSSISETPENPKFQKQCVLPRNNSLNFNYRFSRSAESLDGIIFGLLFTHIMCLVHFGHAVSIN